MATSIEINRALDQHSAWILEQPGVGGCDCGSDPSGKLVLRVFDQGMSDQAKTAICRRVEPVPVTFMPMGPIEAY